jgi:hypothetical protein
MIHENEGFDPKPRRYGISAEVHTARGATFVRLRRPRGTQAILALEEAEAIKDALEAWHGRT